MNDIHDMSLDNEKLIEEYDKEDILYGIEALPEQILLSWGETRDIAIPVSYTRCRNIVVAGMGGSGLGPHLFETTFFDTLKVPFEVINGYHLPKYVSSKTLVILSSFSGDTEEVCAAAKEAKAKKAKCLVITSGGWLERWAKKERVPMFKFVPGELAKQPRCGVGFSLGGVLGLLERASYVRISKSQIDKMIQAMYDVVNTCAFEVPSENNPAKIVAQEIGKFPLLIVASEHLHGNAHTMRNQISETAKHYAVNEDIPELNHFLLEGLGKPENFFKDFRILMIRSNLYDKRVQNRYDITADVFEKQGGVVMDYEAQGDTVLEECGELLQFGSFLAYYLAIQNKVNVYDIPFVDAFKKALKK